MRPMIHRIINRPQFLCRMCDKEIKLGEEYIVNDSGKLLKLCRSCAKDLNAWLDTVDEYCDEEEEY